MSVKPVRPETTNFPELNTHNVLSQPKPTVKIPPRNNLTAASSTYTPRQETTNQEDNKQVEDKQADSKEVVAESKTTREQRRSEWSALDQARKERQKAEELAKKAEKLTNVMSSPSKLKALAETLGMTPDALLLDLQSERLAIPNEKELTPEEKEKQKAQSYEERIAAAEKAAMEAHFMVQANKYINDNIIPVLASDKDAFEFCHKYGIDKCSGEVYRFMNEQYVKSNGQITLDPKEVLTEFENLLFEQYKSAVEYGKDLKKTKSLFGVREEQKAATVSDLQAGLSAAQQMLNDAPQKRIQSRSSGSIPATLPQNKLESSTVVNPNSKYDRQSRLDRLYEMQGIKK
jgi:hypothetical protein